MNIVTHNSSAKADVDYDALYYITKSGKILVVFSAASFRAGSIAGFVCGKLTLNYE